MAQYKIATYIIIITIIMLNFYEIEEIEKIINNFLIAVQ